MTSTVSPPPAVASSSARRVHRASPRSHLVHPRREHDAHRHHRALGRYADWEGRMREVVARPGVAGSVLVVDRDASTLGDPRLLAHLAADEPAENAALVCARYLQDTRGVRCRCRLVTPDDSRTAPFADEPEAQSPTPSAAGEAELRDRLGCVYRLEEVWTGMSIPELRWRRHLPAGTNGKPQLVSVREVIACVESYEPVRTRTRRELALHGGDAGVSSAVLRVELTRMLESPIVLNRKLREVALCTADRQGLSMSEIAIRCGRVKRDRSGNESGETSWLARRLGILPEGGRDAPTPWIHSDVLALIARRGLGISPREVELE
jgi:hypothetical protein